MTFIFGVVVQNDLIRFSLKVKVKVRSSLSQNEKWFPFRLAGMPLIY